MTVICGRRMDIFVVVCVWLCVLLLLYFIMIIIKWLYNIRWLLINLKWMCVACLCLIMLSKTSLLMRICNDCKVYIDCKK